MKVYRYEEERMPHIKVVGKTMRELQNYFLGGEIITVKDESEIKAEEGEYYCLIYNDTPFITRQFLTDLENECVDLHKCYSIGDGFITCGGYDGKYQICENLLAYQVKDYSCVAEACKFMKGYIMDRLSKQNVVIYDPTTTFIDLDVEVEEGAIIHPMVVLSGKTKIGKNAVIFSNTELVDTVVGENVDIRSSYAIEAKIGKNTTVGHNACLRKGANIGSYCRVGDFVEVKNSNIGDGVKMAHLAYVGDSDVGENTNVGCGSVFANYNGRTKNRCWVGSNVFIGANTNLVAPVTVNNGAYIAAGSTITQDIPAGNLCIARSRQVFKENWERK